MPTPDFDHLLEHFSSLRLCVDRVHARVGGRAVNLMADETFRDECGHLHAALERLELQPKPPPARAPEPEPEPDPDLEALRQVLLSLGWAQNIDSDGLVSVAVRALTYTRDLAANTGLQLLQAQISLGAASGRALNAPGEPPAAPQDTSREGREPTAHETLRAAAAAVIRLIDHPPSEPLAVDPSFAVALRQLQVAASGGAPAPGRSYEDAERLAKLEAALDRLDESCSDADNAVDKAAALFNKLADAVEGGQPTTDYSLFDIIVMQAQRSDYPQALSVFEGRLREPANPGALGALPLALATYRKRCTASGVATHVTSQAVADAGVDLANTVADAVSDADVIRALLAEYPTADLHTRARALGYASLDDALDAVPAKSKRMVPRPTPPKLVHGDWDSAAMADLASAPPGPMEPTDVIRLADGLLQGGEDDQAMWPRTVALLRTTLSEPCGYHQMTRLHLNCLVAIAHLVATEGEVELDASLQLVRTMLNRMRLSLPDGILEAVCS